MVEMNPTPPGEGLGSMGAGQSSSNQHRPWSLSSSAVGDHRFAIGRGRRGHQQFNDRHNRCRAVVALWSMLPVSQRSGLLIIMGHFLRLLRGRRKHGRCGRCNNLMVTI